MEEMLAEYATDMYGLRTTSFRISAPVGIGMNPKTIFSVFVENAVKNRPLTIAGKGGRKQTYVHVRDIAQALYLAVIKEKAQGVYNLSSYNMISNKELAELIIKETKSNSEIVYSGIDDKEENYIWDVSLEKIKKDLEYVPKVDLSTAIRELAEFKRKEYD